MIEKEKVIEVKTKEVYCGGGESSHPKVYLSLSSKDIVVCPYCSKRYRWIK